MIKRIVSLVSLLVFFLVFLVLSAQTAFAAEQVLHLNDGSVLRGKLIETRDGVVIFETSVGRISVPQDRIERIEFVGGPDAGPSPAPSGTPPPQQGPWDGPHPAHAAHAAHAPTIYFFGKVGWHHYSGAGWDEFGEYRNDFDGAALEGGMRLRVQDANGLALEVVGTGGYYDGSTCLPDVGGCVDLSFSNVYLDAGPRVEFALHPMALYGQVGVGVYASSFTITAPDGSSETDSRTTGSAHILAGAGFDLAPAMRLFGEVKFVTANGKFPDATENLDMGGTLILLGGSLGF